VLLSRVHHDHLDLPSPARIASTSKVPLDPAATLRRLIRSLSVQQRGS
jgi:hypothetical protein